MKNHVCPILLKFAYKIINCYFIIASTKSGLRFYATFWKKVYSYLQIILSLFTQVIIWRNGYTVTNFCPFSSHLHNWWSNWIIYCPVSKVGLDEEISIGLSMGGVVLHVQTPVVEFRCSSRFLMASVQKWQTFWRTTENFCFIICLANYKNSRRDNFHSFALSCFKKLLFNWSSWRSWDFLKFIWSLKAKLFHQPHKIKIFKTMFLFEFLAPVRFTYPTLIFTNDISFEPIKCQNPLQTLLCECPDRHHFIISSSTVTGQWRRENETNWRIHRSYESHVIKNTTPETKSSDDVFAYWGFESCLNPRTHIK